MVPFVLWTTMMAYVEPNVLPAPSPDKKFGFFEGSMVFLETAARVFE